MQDARGLFLMLKVLVFMGFRWIHGFCGFRCLGTAWFSLALMADRVLSVVFFFWCGLWFLWFFYVVCWFWRCWSMDPL